MTIIIFTSGAGQEKKGSLLECGFPRTACPDSGVQSNLAVGVTLASGSDAQAGFRISDGLCVDGFQSQEFHHRIEIPVIVQQRQAVVDVFPGCEYRLSIFTFI
jgi:hypothetical protein